MNKELFSERLVKERKKKGYKNQTEFAKAYDAMFPTKRKDESAGNVSIGGILGTIKNYENPNYTKSMPTLDKVDNICSLLGCDIDYLTGRIHQESHDIQFICEYTGLSPEAVDLLHLIAQTDIAESKQTTEFLNLALSDPSNIPEKDWFPITTIFSYLYKYISINENEDKESPDIKTLYDFDISQAILYKEIRLKQIQRFLEYLENLKQEERNR